MKARQRLGACARCLFGGLLALLILVPVVWVISTSLKPDNELFITPPTFLPNQWRFDNYLAGWALIPFARYFLSSFLVSIPTAACSVLVCSMAAYAFTRIRFKGRNLVFTLYLSTLMVPQVVRLIPSFIMIKDLKLLNTYTGIVIPQIAWMVPFGSFMIRQFLIALPTALDESAQIDGASNLRIFLQIIMPNVVPAMLTLGIYAFISSWNNLIWTMVAVSKESYRTVTLGLATLTGPSVDFVPPWNLVMAATVISILPILILFLFFQKYFIQSVAMTGVKG